MLDKCKLRCTHKPYWCYPYWSGKAPARHVTSTWQTMWPVHDTKKADIPPKLNNAYTAPPWTTSRHHIMCGFYQRSSSCCPCVSYMNSQSWQACIRGFDHIRRSIGSFRIHTYSVETPISGAHILPLTMCIPSIPHLYPYAPHLYSSVPQKLLPYALFCCDLSSPSNVSQLQSLLHPHSV